MVTAFSNMTLPEKIISKAKKSKPKLQEKQMASKSKIILIGGEIGGVGKSIVARSIVEQTIAAGHPFYLIDADATTPNVGLTYEKAIYERFQSKSPMDKANSNRLINLNASDKPPEIKNHITFTGDAKSYFQADYILELARSKDVIVVLPSQVSLYVNKWIKQNNLPEMLEDPENNIEVYYFFVTNGTPTSIELFIKSVEEWKGKIPHILVKNLGAATTIDWNWFDEDGKAAYILDKYKFKTVEFPELMVLPEVKTKIISENISFGSALKADWMPFPSKRRITNWLKEATMALGATELIPYHPDYKPEEPVLQNF
jgi:hypothetical protein